MKLAVIMPVGPGAQEADRCVDTVRGLVRWEPATRWVVLVDDDREDRDLAAAVARECDRPVVCLRHPLRRRGREEPAERIAAAVLHALGWVERHTDADLVMKLDTDAMVVAPFVDRLGGDIAADPEVGLAGSYTLTCNGDVRDFDPWVAAVRSAHDRRLAVGRGRRVRSAVRLARRNGYVWGEHALACAVAMPRTAVDAIAARGYLEDPALFLGTGLGDDPALGVLVRAVGLKQVNHTGAGQTLAVAWRGLPGTPQELIDRGYSILHSVKNDAHLPEGEIRAMLARREPRGSVGAVEV